MYKTGVTTFQIGSGYNQTARNIDEKLAEKSKEHDQLIDAESIVAIEYRERMFFYRYNDK